MGESGNSARLRALRYWDPPLLVMGVFLTFVVARYMQWGARRDILATIRIELLLGAALILVCIFLLQTAPISLSQLPGARRVVTMISLLFGAMIIQLPLAADPGIASQVFWDRVVKFAMLSLFIAVLIRSPKAMRWFMFAFLFACFYVTQEAARGAFSGGLIWENQGVMRLHGAVPIYAHPNSLAGVAMGVVPFVVFIAPALKSRIWKLIILMPLGTSLICLIYSGSRTGYVAFFAFLLFWWSKSRKKLKWILVAAGISLAAYPLIPDEYIGRFKSIGGQEAEGHSKEKRIVILQDAVTILAENPLGVGVASFPVVRSERFGRSQDTHNLYLEVATNLGIQGFVIFVLLITSLLSTFKAAEQSLEQDGLSLQRWARTQTDRRARRSVERQIQDYRMLKSVAVAASGFIWVRLALGMFGMDLYEVYWWFAAGLAISLEQIAKRVRRNTRRFLISDRSSEVELWSR